MTSNYHVNYHLVGGNQETYLQENYYEIIVIELCQDITTNYHYKENTF
jgi:hypothetical protein